MLLHGFLGRGDDWVDVANALETDFTVLTPDLPGHGDAVKRPDPEYTMDGAADRLAELLNSENIQTAAVIGYSMGGRLALHFALRHPDRFEKLILISASPGLRSEEERVARRSIDRQRATEIEDDLIGFLDSWYKMPLFQSLNDLERDALIAKRSQNKPAELRKSLEGMGLGAQPSHWEHLQDLRVPAWALAGGTDPKFVSIAQEMASVSQVEAVVIPNASHAVPSERPQMLAELLQGLLSANQ